MSYRIPPHDIFNRPGDEGSCPPIAIDGDNPSLSFPLSTPLPGNSDPRNLAGKGGSDEGPAQPGD